jgi:hypothetical protein
VFPWWSRVRLLCTLLAGTSVCCGPATYQPREPRWRRAATGAVRPAQIEASFLPEGSELSLETRLAPGTRLRVAGGHRDRIGPLEESDCVSSVTPLQLIDGRPRWTGAPAELGGRHVLTLRPLRISDYGMSPIALETEREGRTHCSVVALDWPGGWRRVGPWQVSAFAGADVELAHGGGIGGLRLLIARFDDRQRVGVEIGLLNGVLCGGPGCDLAFPIALNLDWAATGLYESGGQDAGITVGYGVRAFLASIHDPESLAVRGGLGSAQLVVWTLFGFVPYPDIDPVPAGAVMDLRLGVGPSLAFEEERATTGVALSLTFGVGWAR